MSIGMIGECGCECGSCAKRGIEAISSFYGFTPMMAPYTGHWVGTDAKDRYLSIPATSEINLGPTDTYASFRWLKQVVRLTGNKNDGTGPVVWNQYTYVLNPKTRNLVLEIWETSCAGEVYRKEWPDSTGVPVITGSPDLGDCVPFTVKDVIDGDAGDPGSYETTLALDHGLMTASNSSFSASTEVTFTMKFDAEDAFADAEALMDTVNFGESYTVDGVPGVLIDWGVFVHVEWIGGSESGEPLQPVITSITTPLYPSLYREVHVIGDARASKIEVRGARTAMTSTEETLMEGNTSPPGTAGNEHDSMETGVSDCGEFPGNELFRPEDIIFEWGWGSIRQSCFAQPLCP